MADHGGNGSGGEVIDRPEDRGGPMATEQEDQKTTEEARVRGAVIEDGGDGGGDQQQEAGDGESRRATVEASPVGPVVEPVGSGTVAEGSPILGRSSGDVEGSGAVGDDTGPSQTLPRDSAKGKGAVVEEEETTEVSSDVAGGGCSVPSCGDSGHIIESRADH
ncbi:hypothetical protein RHMOL_Rhmol05G0142800 [Rhododendron molle]|uniref:Uncharacterized protein n=1 Tax=Rhododendron molle TaxID=49168 RepID=A0ACC0NNQ9_RHOML|nr:hypothetical protein RHMOL_Rhmol05G0142800 [Rhododendron molle]